MYEFLTHSKQTCPSYNVELILYHAVHSITIAACSSPCVSECGGVGWGREMGFRGTKIDIGLIQNKEVSMVTHHKLMSFISGVARRTYFHGRRISCHEVYFTIYLTLKSEGNRGVLIA